ncbi:MAG: transcription termination factor NusA, partial [Patescibacteria group bacterium]
MYLRNPPRADFLKRPVVESYQLKVIQTMLNIKELSRALKQVAEEKGLETEKVLEAIESSIAAAYKKEYGERGEIVKAKLDLKTGALIFSRIKTVVDETTVRFVEEKSEDEKNISGTQEKPRRHDAPPGVGEQTEMPVLPRYNSERHIFLTEAKEINPQIKLGDEMTFPLETQEDFGRIAAQTAKQVILQKLRESERDSILREWHDKEGTIVSGIVQRFERGHVYVDLGRTVGVMFANESIPGEHYRSGERLRFLVLAVQEDARLPGIILSRSHPKFITKLFEMEVPELSEGVVEVKAIAREPGNRTKIAVLSKTEGVDPVGALVGQRGTRVMAVNNELGQEKIDIIEWSDDPQKFIGNSLSPAKVLAVEILPRNRAIAKVPEDQLSLAIGREGQNVRLAAKLTGWKIDVRTHEDKWVATEDKVAEEKKE